MTDDQIIDCQRLWSVSELKEHLFKEYPTHPKPESQKLIYSGKLLSDNMILRDVLKTFGGHEYNTIHLVCSLRESYRARAQVPAPPLVKPVRTTPEPSFISNSPTNNFVPSVSNIPRSVPNREWQANRITNEDIERYMIMVQQAYTEYIANFLNAQTNRYGNEREAEIEEIPPVEPDLHNNIPQPNNNNNVEREAEDDGAGQRDWLEWIYIITRLMVLFSVVYFYSSPLRFFVVMTMALLLFNMDVERWRRRNEQPDNAHMRHNGNNGDNTEQVEHELHELPRPHPFNIVSTFVTSFFLSIIPEQRAI
ncbi:hypothetical protein O3M35_004003 [Rhynocoris fuscipes]|uniref:Ubiquitin-like domain-containing protein n=1 Tax=Rhynocoris fuscipes TaxID=488301 RepID=A0AAW1CJ61_9HEMI